MSQDEKGPSGSDQGGKGPGAFLLTCGRAWSISLASKSTTSEEILKLAFDQTAIEAADNLLYRLVLYFQGHALLFF